MAIPDSDVRGLIAKYREAGMSRDEILENLLKLKISLTVRDRSTRFVGGAAAKDDEEGWATALKDRGFSEAEIAKIISKNS